MMSKVLLALLIGQAAAASSILSQEMRGSRNNQWCMDGHAAPSVFLAGFQKAGTTSLWHDMVNRLNMKTARQVDKEAQFRDKEVSFFSNSDRFKQGKQFYLSHFPTCAEVGPRDRVIDGSPNTMFALSDSPKKISEFYGDSAKDLKFVIIVRDPASRMESAYWHFENGVDGDFNRYVEKTLGQAKSWAQTGADEPVPNLYEASLYSKHITSFLQYFKPEQFTFVTLQQYKEKNAETMSFIAKRIGMHMTDKTDAPVREHQRKHPMMSAATRQALNEFFASSEKELQQLVQDKHLGFGDGVISTNHALLQVDDAAESMNSLVEDQLKSVYGTFAASCECETEKVTLNLEEEIHGDHARP